MALGWLIVVVALAFTVEAALGFGATVIAVALGAFLWPIDELLSAFVPVNVLLSGLVVARAWRHLRLDVLGLRILPWMGLGFPLGAWLAAVIDPSTGKRGFGALMIALAALDLTGRVLHPRGVGANTTLVAAGVVHGLFATGGPLAVWVTAGLLPDKDAFRATMSLLWLVFNVLLLSTWAWTGRLTATSLTTSAVLLLPLLVGLGAGEQIHRRLDPVTFRRGVFAGIGLAGLILLIRG